MKHLLLSLAGILTLALALCLPAQGQSAQDLLQQGSRLEQVEGDYEGAIALYRQIAENQSADRRLVARALLQMGKAYEMLGRDGARDAYTRIVNEYGDFASVAGEAAERMAAFRRLDSPARLEAPVPGSLGEIVLEAEQQNSLWGAGMSPDGKYIVRGRGMVLQHIESGAVDSMAALGRLCVGYSRAMFSPSGDRIAFDCSLEETVGVAVYDRPTGTAKLIFNAGDHFGTTPEERVHQGVYDWSGDGNSVLVLVGLRNPEDSSRKADHLLLVPVSGGPPTVIDGDTSKSGLWVNRVCLLRDGRFLMGQYGSEGSSIHAVDTKTGQHVSVVSDDTFLDMLLWDCLPQSNTVVYSHDLNGTTVLFAATVGSDGGIGAPRFLANLPEGGMPVPGARDGNVYYSVVGQPSFVAVADVDTLRGLAVSNTRMLKAGSTFSYPRWSPDGNHLVATVLGQAMIEGFNPSASTTWSTIRHLGHMIWSPDGSQLISSHPPDSSAYDFMGTQVFERDSGEVVQQVPDLAAVAWLPDATGFYYVAEEDGQQCLSTFIFATRATGEVFCLDAELTSVIPVIPDSRPNFKWRWQRSPGWALSPDGSTFAFWGSETTEPGQGRPMFLLDTVTWKMEQIVGLIYEDPQVSWSGDSKSLYVYGDQNNTVRAYSLARGEWTDWSLPEMGAMKFRTVAIHPSGTRVAVMFANWLWLPPGTRLSVLHQPPGLLEAK